MERLADLLPDKDKYLSKGVILENTEDTPEKDTPTDSPILLPETDKIQKVKPETPEVALMRMTLYKIKDQVDILLHLLEDPSDPSTAPLPHLPPPPEQAAPPLEEVQADRIVEGLFTGEKMRSYEGELFEVPANYASKSKLTVGDTMKLTIPKNGSFIYKQISQVERKHLRGELVCGNTSGQWLVETENKSYKVLTAAVTFHKGRIGDEVILLVPEHQESDWGAVEHIIHKEL